MKSDKKLLELVYRELLIEEASSSICDGLCLIILKLYEREKITFVEKIHLRRLIMNNIKENTFINRLIYFPDRLMKNDFFSSYFWPREDFESRKNYLKYLISKA